MPADAHELQAGGFGSSLGFEPLGTLAQDGRDHHERFDVVDDGRLVPEAMSAGEGWLVARLGAVALKHLQQGRLFTADVAAGADEERNVERVFGPEDASDKDALTDATVQLASKRVRLHLVLVAKVDDASSRAGDEPREDHALDDQMGDALHGEAVLDRPG